MAHPLTSMFAVDKVALSNTASVNTASNARYSGVTRVGKFLYVAGDLWNRSVFTGNRVTAVGVLDLPRKHWRWIGFNCHIIKYPKVLLLDDKMYVFCKQTFRGEQHFQVSLFDLVEEEWSLCATKGKSPSPRIFFAGDYLERQKRYVVFGGQGGNAYHNDVHLLVVPECRWVKPETKGQQPEGRYTHGSCVAHGKVFYYGGWGRFRRNMDGLFILTIQPGDKAIWSSVKTNAQDFTRISSFALVPFKGKFLLCGGGMEGGWYGLGVYDHERKEFKDIELPPETANSFGFGSAPFITEDGNAVGLLGGNGKLDSYIRVAQVE